MVKVAMNRSINSIWSRFHDAVTAADTSSKINIAQTFSIDRKTIDKAGALMDKVVKLCSQPRLNLRNSPPFILDILPDTYQHIHQIVAKDDQQLLLAGNKYFYLFIENLIQKCKETVKLFRKHGDAMFKANSEGRRSLTKLSLVFSHMLAELKAEFPDGHWKGESFRITKSDAEAFWKVKFGSA